MKGQVHNNASSTRLHFWAQLSTSGLLLPGRHRNFLENHFIHFIATLEKDSVAMRLSLKTIILALSSGLVQVAAIAVPLPAAFAGNRTYTYTACYFQKGNDLSSIKWQWGLQANNSWYQMNGRWVDTPRTRVKEALGNKPAQCPRSWFLFSLNYLRVDWASMSLISSF